MIQVNRIYLIFNRLVTKKFLVDTSVEIYKIYSYYERKYLSHRHLQPELIGIYVNP